jgi:hypothetical protein
MTATSPKSARGRVPGWAFAAAVLLLLIGLPLAVWLDLCAILPNARSGFRPTALNAEEAARTRKILEQAIAALDAGRVKTA